MKSFDYVITDPVGIHARPAGILVKEVKNYKDSTITLATDDSAYLLHLSGNINLAYCSSGILAAMLLSNIAQSTGRA